MARPPVAPSLNFLRQRRHKLAALRQQDKLVLYVLSGIFGVVVVVAIGLAVYLFTQKQRFNSLSTSNTQATKALASLATEEAEYLVFFNRLQTLVTIWPTRGSQQKTLEFLTDLTLPDVAYQQVTFEQTTRLLQFSVVADDFFAFEKFINVIKEPEIHQRVKSFDVSTVRRNEEGRYVFTVQMVLEAQT